MMTDARIREIYAEKLRPHKLPHAARMIVEKREKAGSRGVWVKIAFDALTAFNSGAGVDE